MNKYHIHDNGGRPFMVEVKGNIVRIYKNLGYDSDNEDNDNGYIYDKDPFYGLKANKVFIGKSPKNEMTEFSGGYGERFDGNSILLHKSGNEYVYIGSTIFSFKSLAEITEYVSPVGNNDVPYPYAIDKKSNYYLLIEDVILKDIPSKHKDEPYEYYYEKHLITADDGRVPPKQPSIKNFQGIVSWFINDDPCTFTYTTRPVKEFKRLLEKSTDKMFVKRTDGKKYELTEEAFVKLMKDFGKEKGFTALKDVSVIHKRLW